MLALPCSIDLHISGLVKTGIPDQFAFRRRRNISNFLEVLRPFITTPWCELRKKKTKEDNLSFVLLIGRQIPIVAYVYTETQVSHLSSHRKQAASITSYLEDSPDKQLRFIKVSDFKYTTTDLKTVWQSQTNEDCLIVYHLWRLPPIKVWHLVAS